MAVIALRIIIRIYAGTCGCPDAVSRARQLNGRSRSDGIPPGYTPRFCQSGIW
jgi:hypothetical protein